MCVSESTTLISRCWSPVELGTSFNLGASVRVNERNENANRCKISVSFGLE